MKHLAAMLDVLESHRLVSVPLSNYIFTDEKAPEGDQASRTDSAVTTETKQDLDDLVTELCRSLFPQKQISADGPRNLLLRLPPEHQGHPGSNRLCEGKFYEERPAPHRTQGVGPHPTRCKCQFFAYLGCPFADSKNLNRSDPGLSSRVVEPRISSSKMRFSVTA